MRKIKWFLIAVLYLFGQTVFGQIDTRLKFVSNTGNTPSVGKATLVIDIEARSYDGFSHNIHVFQGAFQIDETLKSQSPSIYFTDQLLSSEIYNTTEDYRSSDRRIRYVYTYDSGTCAAIGTSWTRVVRVNISYTMTDKISELNWYTGLPNYLVTDSGDNTVTGSEELIPIDLQTIDLEPNQPSIVDAGKDTVITIGDTAYLHGIVEDDGLIDPPGFVTTTWSKQNGSGLVTFGDSGSLETTAAFSDTGIYVLKLSAYDGEFQVLDSVRVTVQPVNQAPVVNAGEDQLTALPNNTVSLSGTVSDDGYPDPPGVFTVIWTKISGYGTVMFGDVNLPNTTATFSDSGTYVLRLTADDSQLQSYDEVTITVHPENQAPVVNAGEDQFTALPNNTVSLSGTVSDDGYPDPPGSYTVTWNKINGYGSVIFGDVNSPNTTATFSDSGTYVLRLTADDSELQSYDEITITVHPENQAPVVNAGEDHLTTLPNNTVSLSGTVSDDGYPDPPESLTVIWTKINGYGSVIFGDVNAPNTTATFSDSGTYVLRLTADDSELQSYDEVTITVHPENQAPLVNAGEDQIITLPDVVNLAGIISDDGYPDPPGTVKATWSKQSGPFTVVFEDSNALNTTASFSDSGTYVLRLTADDSELQTYDEVVITVYPANLPPIVNAGEDQLIALPNNTVNLAGTVSDDGKPDPPGFVTTVWSKVGELDSVIFENADSLNTTATFSDSGIYILRLTADDGVLQSFDDVVITVHPVNQPPVVDAGENVGITISSATVIQGTLEDDGYPDPPGSVTTVWSKQSGTGTVTFENANSLLTTATFSDTGTYILRLTANDGEYQIYDTTFVLVQYDNVTVISNKTWETGKYTFKDVAIKNNSILTFNGAVTLNCSNLTIDLGSCISADYKGYAGGKMCENGKGPGGGIYGTWKAGSGAGHGGNGGKDAQGDSGGEAYGSLTEPTESGSGGAGGYRSRGGSGGGTVILNISDALIINGVVTSNGENGTYTISTAGSVGGGGSGGSIKITAGSISGTGIITANGGEGPVAIGYVYSGGGGGGRIAIYSDISDFSGTISAFGGSGVQYGGAGTIFIKPQDSPNGYLLVDNNNNKGAETPQFTSENFDSLVIKGQSCFYITGGAAINTIDILLESFTLTNESELNITGLTDISSGIFTTNNGYTSMNDVEIYDEVVYAGLLNANLLTVKSGAILTHPSNLDTMIYWLEISSNNLTVESGSQINADYKGYSGGKNGQNGNGPGCGIYGAERAGSGAGYGGTGGIDIQGDSGGSIYGSEIMPVDLGSGGGGGSYSKGGNGGGLIVLNVSETLKVDGSISAIGADGIYNGAYSGSHGGGGSGGSIYITTNSIEGNGTLIVNGGNSHMWGYKYGGGGGGGRIAVYYNNSSYTGLAEAKGGDGWEPGGDGTIVYTVADSLPDSFVIFATNSVRLREDVQILSGNVGVNGAGTGDSNYELIVGSGVNIAEGYSLKARHIRIEQDAHVTGSVFCNDIENCGTITGFLDSTSTLPMFNCLPPFYYSTGGTQDITVLDNDSLILTEGNYGNIRVNENGKILFTGGIYNIRSIDFENRVKLIFMSCSEIRVSDSFNSGLKCYIGPDKSSSIDASNVIFYVAGSSVDIGDLCEVGANFYVPNGKLLLGEKSIAEGAFLGEDIIVEKEVVLTLNSFLTKRHISDEEHKTNVLSELEIPEVFALEQNYPNPFNPETKIRFQVPFSSHVILKIFNIYGREICTVIDGHYNAGYHFVTWDGRNKYEIPVSSGVYLYRIQAGEFVEVKKMSLLK